MDGLFPGMEAKKKKPKQTNRTVTPDHDPRIALFQGHWDGLWMKKYNQIYIHAWARDGAIIKRLLQSLDTSFLQDNTPSLKRLLIAAERFFNGHLKWYKGVETIGAFAKHINHLLQDQPGGTTAVKPTTEQLDRYRSLDRSGD
jgi:hypothetical protein